MKFFRVLCTIALALGCIACNKDNDDFTINTTLISLGTPPNNEIWFTTTDGRELMSLNEEAFDVAVEDVIYSEYGINIILFDGRLTTIGEEAFRDAANIFNLSLPNSVQEIGARAFYDCKNIECLTLGTGLRHCKEAAFDNCINLHSLHIPNIESWCKISFDSDTANPAYYSQSLLVERVKISELHIPEGITSLSKYAFCGNIFIKSVHIPSSLSDIGKRAFAECNALTKVYISDIDKWCQISFEDEEANPLSGAQSLYMNGAKVSTLNIDDIATIAPRAFINCTSIKSLSIGDSVHTIGLEALRNCTGLTNVTLGGGISTIGERAFMGCKKLSQVKCYATTPPTLGDSYVFGYNADNRTIAVPSVALDNYKTSWSSYADSIVAIE